MIEVKTPLHQVSGGGHAAVYLGGRADSVPVLAAGARVAGAGRPCGRLISTQRPPGLWLRLEAAHVHLVSGVLMSSNEWIYVLFYVASFYLKI